MDVVILLAMLIVTSVMSIAFPGDGTTWAAWCITLLTWLAICFNPSEELEMVK
jgi:hypothetical protein